MKPTLRGANGAAFNCKDHEWMLAGASECVSAETEIETNKGPKKITDLMLDRVAPVVHTLYGLKQANVPFLKGVARMYKIYLETGESFEATAKHFVLSSEGFLPCELLKPGALLLGYDVCRPQSIADNGRSVHVSSGQSWFEKAEGFQGGYPGCPYSCDEQLPSFVGNGPETSPLLNDVPAHNDVVGLGVPGQPIHASSLSQICGHPSTNREAAQVSLLEMFSSHHAFSDIQARELWLYRLLGLLPSMFATRPSSLQDRDSVGIDSYAPIMVRQKRVAIVEFVGWSEYYDMSVPEAGHYFANGCIHHNTGKTVACCCKVHAMACEFPHAHLIIARKIYKAMRDTVLRTFASVIDGYGVRILGGEHPSAYMYPNGSRVLAVGMDNPGSLLSGEFDGIYANQAEELTESHWEMMASRCTGRGAVVKNPQVFGDCNPGGRLHWIRDRVKRGVMVLFESKHTHNPSLYEEVVIIEQGKKERVLRLTKDGKLRLERLKATLSGVRYQRLFEGKWATAEGAVYEHFSQAHVCERPLSEMKQFYLTLDEGYTNPAVVLVVGEDSDGRWHVFKEFYERGVLRHVVVKKAKEWYVQFGCQFAAVDGAAAGLIADLNDCGVDARGGKGRVLDGIQHIQDKLKTAGDGQPRLTIDPSCVCTINDFESYVWKPEKDVPVKENDHASDALRYLDDILAVPSGAFMPGDNLGGRPSEIADTAAVEVERLGAGDF